MSVEPDVPGAEDCTQAEAWPEAPSAIVATSRHGSAVPGRSGTFHVVATVADARLPTGRHWSLLAIIGSVFLVYLRAGQRP
jgi:hypothetical protein